MDRHALVDVRECRALGNVEVRRSSSGSELRIRGHASTWQPYQMYGGPARGGWIEQIARGAFADTLAENPDVHLLVNHEGLPLARTASDTLRLSTDDVGLLVEATLDMSDPDVQRIEPKLRRRDMTEMSFAFRVRAQQWSADAEFPSDPESHRLITDLTLHKGDVSVVNWGANPTTDVEALSMSAALARIAAATPGELVAARADSDAVGRALAALRGPAPAVNPGNGGMALADARAACGLADPAGATLTLAEALRLI